MDEFASYDNHRDERILMTDCFEILEELTDQKLSKKFIQQFCDKVLALKEDLVNYRKIVSFIFTGKTSVNDQYNAMNHEMINDFA